ncbi:MAG TPA: outer membrane protein assembly factor BamD [Vicinamibacterales bacterium]|nr:outer membrane protein assembly factor BamD [Vicinamibacterales bacterium]HPW22115.1 outer membrane protein assembly factor BamD [Vicinamibacterales bacterium]
MPRRSRRVALPGLFLVALGLAPGCAGNRNPVPPGILEGDRYLFERAAELVARKKWSQARAHYVQLVDNYPQSAYRPDAKLGLGDTYFGENTVESLVLAQNEYREFLTFYPTNPRADYAQFRIGMCHFGQMQSAERDQTATKDAIAEFTAFLERFPESPLVPDAQTKLREAQTRLTDSHFKVGYFYYRSGWYPGAISRFQAVLKDDPDFPYRDAVYYYLGDTLLKAGRHAEALPYFDRVLKEFENSSFAPLAKKGLQTPAPRPATPEPAKK